MKTLANRLARLATLLFALTAAVELRADTSGSDDARFSPVTQRMKEFVDKGEIAGAVTLVVTPEKVVHHAAVGKADVASDRAMAPDTIFWIASMTKPVTG